VENNTGYTTRNPGKWKFQWSYYSGVQKLN
jgi:hypothetical protein